MEKELVLAILFWTGVIISLIFRIPKVKNWYDEKSKAFKTYFMLGVNVLAGLLIMGFVCGGIPGMSTVTCDLVGVQGVLIALGTIVGGNQAAYMIPEGMREKNDEDKRSLRRKD